MAAIDTPLKQPLPDKDKRGRIATVCALCVWVVVLALCWSFLTDVSLLPYDRESAFTYMMMSFFAVAVFFISVYKIINAISNLYEHRRGDSSPSDLPET